MLSDPSPPTKRDFIAHSALSNKYGVKAAGLAFLPSAWRPEFVALSIDVQTAWRNGSELSENHEVAGLLSWLDEKSYDRVILRSSGVAETLNDRGKFKSNVLPERWTNSDILEGLADLFASANQVDAEGALGVVVQSYIPADFAGHLSNEYRVSPTINQWSYELELPQWAPAKGINSKFTTSPDPTAPLHCGSQIPHQPLRSVAHYLASEFEERCHLEWIVADNSLFLVQIDFEWPAIDVGLDPRKDLIGLVPASLNLGIRSELRPFKVGTRTKWSKLKNLSEFDFTLEDQLAPKIYPLKPEWIEEARVNKERRASLVREIEALTGNCLVVRTDCVAKGVRSFNLPRTDTVTAKCAVTWCMKVVGQFENEGIAPSDFIFLFHAFLPAKASAWAYARPDSPIVIVDALWGLPDGMQVLPVDTYEVNVAQKKIIATKTTYKPQFLTQLDDGSWDYRSVRRRSARGQVLTKADKLEIAQRTHRIAKSLNGDAQIMWFCDIPAAYQVGKNLPWFRSREILDPSPRQEVQFKPFQVSTLGDLERLPKEKVTIQLSPEANLIRDDGFLERIIVEAKERNLPVQLEGSILGHAYYRLNQEGVPIVLSNAPKYYRKRNQKVFGKIVRDKIPASIVEGGELVREATLASGDLRVGLAGKLLEELEEFLRAQSDEESVAELADVLEVVKGLAHASGHSWAKIERVAKDKAARRGGFKAGRVLIETGLPHRESPLEREEQVRIADLGRVESKANSVEIPPSALVSTTQGPGVIFSFQGDGVRYRISMKEGRTIVSKLDSRISTGNGEQKELF